MLLEDRFLTFYSATWPTWPKCLYGSLASLSALRASHQALKGCSLSLTTDPANNSQDSPYMDSNGELTCSWSSISASSSLKMSVSPRLASIFFLRIWARFWNTYTCFVSPLSLMTWPLWSITMHLLQILTWSVSQKYFVRLFGCFRQYFSVGCYSYSCLFSSCAWATCFSL